MRKAILLAIISLTAIFLGGCTETEMKNAANDVLEQAESLADSNDPHVQGVKNGTNSNHPGVTYGEAFDYYFGNGKWRYFVGSHDGPDEDGDGEPDYTVNDVDVVEFTGYCMYSDVKVKALIQFELSKDDSTFEAVYLSFNDVPQNKLMLTGLIGEVFDTYEENVGAVYEEYDESEDDDLIYDALGDDSSVGVGKSPEMVEYENVRWTVDDFLKAYIEDINSGFYVELEGFVMPGSNMDECMTNCIGNADFTESLVGYDISDIKKIDENTYHVTTIEEYNIFTYDITVPSSYIKQKCIYELKEVEDGIWMVSDYVGDVEVIEREDY